MGSFESHSSKDVSGACEEVCWRKSRLQVAKQVGRLKSANLKVTGRGIFQKATNTQRACQMCYQTGSLGISVSRLEQ